MSRSKGKRARCRTGSSDPSSRRRREAEHLYVYQTPSFTLPMRTRSSTRIMSHMSRRIIRPRAVARHRCRRVRPITSRPVFSIAPAECQKLWRCLAAQRLAFRGLFSTCSQIVTRMRWWLSSARQDRRNGERSHTARRRRRVATDLRARPFSIPAITKLYRDNVTLKIVWSTRSSRSPKRASERPKARSRSISSSRLSAMTR